MRNLALVALIFMTKMSFCETPCELALSGVIGADTSWRNSFTHPLADGTRIATDAQREQYIQNSVRFQTSEIRGVYAGHSDTPPMVVIPTSDTKIKFTRPWEEYGAMKADVIGAPSGFIRATVLLPVSAHTGIRDALVWSRSDTYSLVYEDPSGAKFYLIKDASSLDLVTAQEVKIPLVDGRTVKLLYYRSGSGGPAGYAGGRELQLTWNKNVVDTTPVDPSAKFWDNPTGQPHFPQNQTARSPRSFSPRPPMPTQGQN